MSRRVATEFRVRAQPNAASGDARQQLIPVAGASNFSCSSRDPTLGLRRMQSLLDLFRTLRDPGALIAWGGYVGLTAIIFAETGLLVGFFLPGDSLIVTAGLLSATTGVFNVY